MQTKFYSIIFFFFIFLIITSVFISEYIDFNNESKSQNSYNSEIRRNVQDLNKIFPFLQKIYDCKYYHQIKSQRKGVFDVPAPPTVKIKGFAKVSSNDLKNLEKISTKLKYKFSMEIDSNLFQYDLKNSTNIRIVDSSKLSKITSYCLGILLIDIDSKYIIFDLEKI